MRIGILTVSDRAARGDLVPLADLVSATPASRRGTLLIRVASIASSPRISSRVPFEFSQPGTSSTASQASSQRRSRSYTSRSVSDDSACSTPS